jgi:hypothetical protein
LDFLETMDVRQIRQAGYFQLVLLTVLSCGCSSLWREAPSPVPRPPKVRMDASWFLENPSKDVVTRIAEERKTHIETVLASREKGVVSIPLRDAICGDTEASDKLAGSTTASTPDESYSVTIDVNPEQTAEKSGSGGFMIKLNRGTNDGR